MNCSLYNSYKHESFSNSKVHISRVNTEMHACKPRDIYHMMLDLVKYRIELDDNVQYCLSDSVFGAIIYSMSVRA